MIKLALYELGMDLVIDCAVYFIADIDGEWDSFEIETFVTCLAKTVFDGISLGVSIYNLSKTQKLILTNIDDGASMVLKKNFVEENVTYLSRNTIKEFDAPDIYLNKHNQYTNGKYTVSMDAMKRHCDGKFVDNKSQFLYNVDANKAVLDAAAYADSYNLWDNNGQAKVRVTNGMVGILGNSRELTNYICVSRTRTNMIHGWPCEP